MSAIEQEDALLPAERGGKCQLSIIRRAYGHIGEALPNSQGVHVRRQSDNRAVRNVGSG